MKHLMSSAKLLSVVILALGPVAVLEMSISDHGAAYAEKSNGNSGDKGNHGGNGKGGEKGNNGHKGAEKAAGKSDQGALASELKGMNAVHANPNALLNADPDSQVGRIAAYRDAALATTDAADAVHTAQVNLTAAEGQMATAKAMPATTQAEIDARNAAITAAEIAISTATTDLGIADGLLQDAADLEDAALLTATEGRVLSDEALAYVRAELGL